MSTQGQDVVAALDDLARDDRIEGAMWNVIQRAKSEITRLAAEIDRLKDIISDPCDWKFVAEKRFRELTRLRTLLSSSRGESVVRERLTSALNDFLVYYHGTDEQQAELQADFSGPDGLRPDAELRSLIIRNAQKALAESWELDGTIPSATGSVPTSNNTTINSALRTLANVWEMDGDLMRCRGCGRALIASLDGEALHHSAECKHKERGHPWTELRNILGAVPTSLAGQVPDGYVLVPKEPTAEIIQAWRAVFSPWPFENNAYYAMLSAAPQPTAGGDAPSVDTLAYRVACIRQGQGDTPRFEGPTEFDIRAAREWVEYVLKAFTDWHPKDALSAERTRVIEECAKWHEEQAEFFTAGAKSHHARGMPVPAFYAEGEAQMHRKSAAALRALGQQDTGGADHG